ncbi:MAG: tyrosine-type recombinase/integrase [Acholeplasmatales bacterium]|nr:tyrosine-type recombinase/integrase [Acholeplasmatales bacterium]
MNLEKRIKLHNNLKTKKYELLIKAYALSGNIIVKKEISLGYFKSKSETDKYVRLHINELLFKFSDAFNLVLGLKQNKTNDYINDLKFGYSKIPSLHNKCIFDIKLDHLIKCLGDIVSKSNRKKARLVISLIYKLLFNSNIIKQDLSKLIYVANSINSLKYNDNPFSKYELDILEKNESNNYGYHIIKFMINTGIGIYNTLNLKTSQIDLNKKILLFNKYSVAKKVSLNDIALAIVIKYYDLNKEYLFNNHLGKVLEYTVFQRFYFNKLMKKYSFIHTPNDCYKTYLFLTGSVEIKDRKRRKNGAGTIKVYNDGREKKYMVLASIYKDGEIKQVSIGSYKYKYEAEAKSKELLENKNHIDKSKYAYTFKDVYFLFLENKKIQGVSKNPEKAYKYAFKAVSFIHNIIFAKLTHRDLYKALEKSGKNYPTLKIIIILFHGMYRYAIEEGITYKDESNNIRIGKYSPLYKNPNSIERKVFTGEEIQKIFNDDINIEMKNIFKVLIYTGMRINEFISLTKDAINLDNKTIYIKKEYSKTDNSNRYIPIHPDIFDIIKNKYNECIYDDEPLFKNNKGNILSYRCFRDTYWISYMNYFGFKHTPHDTRYTFKTFCGYSNIRERDVEIIMGHSVNGDVSKLYDQPEMLHRYKELCKLKFNIDFNIDND